jgi:hypothetical protein
MRLVYFVVAVVLFAPLKLVSDNLLYAALIRRLKAHGIEEDSLIAFFATNLIPITATFIIMAIIYRVAASEHRSPLAREHSQIVKKAFSALGPEEIRWLRDHYAGGRPPDHLGSAFVNAGLIDRDFAGYTEVKEPLKPVIAQKFRTLRNREHFERLARKLEPSHLIAAGLLLAFAGVVWQMVRTPPPDPKIADLQSQLQAVTQERDKRPSADEYQETKNRLAQLERGKASASPDEIERATAPLRSQLADAREQLLAAQRALNQPKAPEPPADPFNPKAQNPYPPGPILDRKLSREQAQKMLDALGDITEASTKSFKIQVPNIYIPRRDTGMTGIWYGQIEHDGFDKTIDTLSEFEKSLAAVQNEITKSIEKYPSIYSGSLNRILGNTGLGKMRGATERYLRDLKSLQKNVNS